MNSSTNRISTRHNFTDSKTGYSTKSDQTLKYMSKLQDRLSDECEYLNMNVIRTEHKSINEIDMMLASEIGDYHSVESLIAHGADNNKKEKDGWTSLMLAAQNGHKDVVQLILRHGADVNSRCREGNTALMVAAQYGHTTITEILLQNKADINNENEKKVKAIFLATQNDHYDTVKLLLHYAYEQGILKDVDKQVSLYLAILNGCESIVELFWRYGAEINKSIVSSNWNIIEIDKTVYKMKYFCVDKEGYSELRSQYVRKRKTVKKKTRLMTFNFCTLSRKNYWPQHLQTPSICVLPPCVLSGNYSTHICFKSRQSEYEFMHAPISLTPLIIASFNGNVRIIQMLLENGADIHEADKWGKTSLIIATGSGHVEAVELLLSRGANVNHISQNGFTAVTIASFNGYVNVLEVLLNYKADVNITLEDKVTALMLATQKNNLQIVELLLRNGADFNASQSQKWSSLMIGSLLGFVEIVKLLIEHKADVNQMEDGGWSALMLACKQGHHEVVKVLLQNGANVNQKEKSHKMSSLSIASYENLPDIVETLLKNGAKVDHKTTHLWTPLMISCKEGHIEVVRCLLKYKPNINISDKNGVTALTLATEFNHEDIVEILCENKASTKARAFCLFKCLGRHSNKIRTVKESVMHERTTLPPIKRPYSIKTKEDKTLNVIYVNIKKVKQIDVRKSDSTIVQHVGYLANDNSTINVKDSSRQSEDSEVTYL